MRARAYIIKVYVAVGAYGIVQPRLLAAGVGYLFVVRVPRQLLHSAEGFHRALKRRAVEDVHALTDLGALDALAFTVITNLQRTNKRLRSRLGPLVPMLVHQVFVNMSGR